MDRNGALRLLEGGLSGIEEWNQRRKTGVVIPSLHGAYLNRTELREADLGGLDLREAFLREADLRGARLSEANLKGAHLGDAKLSGADLNGTDLNGADLSGTDLSGADLSGAGLCGADLSGADLRSAILFGANVGKAKFIGADLRRADLRRAVLCEADLGGVDLSGCHLCGADLKRANLKGADLKEVSFNGASFGGADLRRAVLCEADLGGVDLSGALLVEANLSGANLCKIGLSGANLRSANLNGANLRAADLAGADLRDVDLSQADLRECNLAKAVLAEGRLIESDLRGAILSDASLKLSRLIRCSLDGVTFEGANVTDCHVQETKGRPVAPILLHVDNREPLTGDDARDFFNPPAIVEVYLTELLTDDEIGAYHFHLGDVRRQGVGPEVFFVGSRREGGGTVLRYQASTYAEIYDVLPILLAPFRMSRAVDWAKTFASMPDHERVGVLTALAKIEADDPAGRWLFAERMAEVFGSFPRAKVKQIRDGRNLGVRIEVATNQAISRELAQSRVATRPVTRQQIVNVLADGPPRIALEDHSVTNDVNAQGNITGSAIGSGNTVNARDITGFIEKINQTQGLDDDLKRAIIDARQALESAGLDVDDKGDAFGDLARLASELNGPKPKPGRIRRLLENLKELAPSVATILESAVKIAALARGG